MKKVTKKWRKEQAQKIIDRNVIGVPFNDFDLHEFSEVLEQDIDGAVRKVNPEFPGDPRHVLTLIDGVWEARSWNKMISQNHTPESEAKRVMRRLIKDDLQEFKDSFDFQECQSCGANDDITVDHVYPPFSKIADDFISEYGLPVVIDNPDPNKVCKMFDSFEMEANWVHFHCSHAVYQLLCRSCNARKGNK